VWDLSQFFVMKNCVEMVQVIEGLRPRKNERAERAFYRAFLSRFSLLDIVRMTPREPVTPRNRYWCDELELYCQHWPARGAAMDPRPRTDPLHVSDDMPGKRETLQMYPGIRRGEAIRRLLDARDLSYYNAGALRY
jgi:hypothetical protein